MISCSSVRWEAKGLRDQEFPTFSTKQWGFMHLVRPYWCLKLSAHSFSFKHHKCFIDQPESKKKKSHAFSAIWENLVFFQIAKNAGLSSVLFPNVLHSVQNTDRSNWLLIGQGLYLHTKRLVISGVRFVRRALRSVIPPWLCSETPAWMERNV